MIKEQDSYRFSLRDIEKEGLWIANIGKQIDSKGSSLDWSGFIYPKHCSIKIDTLRLNPPHTISWSGSPFSTVVLKFSDGKTEWFNEFDISQTIIDENDNCDNYININHYSFMHYDKEFLTNNFITDLKRILAETWSGYNGMSKSKALKNMLLSHPEAREYFETDCPELLL